MKTRVLIAFETVHGATAEVAETLAGHLRTLGLEVDVQPAGQVKNLEGYRGVILGAPLYLFRWHKGAFRFLSRFKGSIQAGIPVAVFAGGPFGETKPETWNDVRTNLDKQLARVPWLKPTSVLLIGGRFDPAGLRFPYDLIPTMKQQPYSDLRNWEEIQAWANLLATTFQ